MTEQNVFILNEDACVIFGIVPILQSLKLAQEVS